MRYLSGSKHPSIADDLGTGRIGLLNSPRIAYSLEGVAVWAADNGCFTGSYPGDDKYLGWLERRKQHQSRCLFVAAPDVLGDAAATLERFPGMAHRLRGAGWPVALVGQDGMEAEQVPWGLVDWLFVGGTTEWKMGKDARRLIMAALERGVPVHVGRVNSWRRYATFAVMGCASVDGTMIAFGGEKAAEEIRRWVGC